MLAIEKGQCAEYGCKACCMTTAQAISATGASTAILYNCRIESMAYTALRVRASAHAEFEGSGVTLFCFAF